MVCCAVLEMHRDVVNDSVTQCSAENGKRVTCLNRVTQCCSREELRTDNLWEIDRKWLCCFIRSRKYVRSRFVRLCRWNYGRVVLYLCIATVAHYYHLNLLPALIQTPVSAYFWPFVSHQSDDPRSTARHKAEFDVAYIVHLVEQHFQRLCLFSCVM